MSSFNEWTTARRPLVIAHRGANSRAPENTISAFSAARDLGADGIEMDVKLTTDGQVVVMHDQTVDRTTDGHGLLRNFRLEGGALILTSASAKTTLTFQRPAK